MAAAVVVAVAVEVEVEAEADEAASWALLELARAEVETDSSAPSGEVRSQAAGRAEKDRVRREVGLGAGSDRGSRGCYRHQKRIPVCQHRLPRHGRGK